MIADGAIVETAVIHVCRPITWPETVERHLAALPKRWLLRNERVSVILTGMARDGSLGLGPWPQACLLVVTFGKLHLVTGENHFYLEETDSMVVTPGVRHELHAPDTADFLLMNLTPPNGWLSRCLCHGTAGRKEMLKAADELLGIHAQL